MALDGLSLAIERREGARGGWIRLSDVSRGQGLRWLTEELLLIDPLATRRKWFGRLDSIFPGQRTLPLLTTTSTPAAISNSETDYASVAELWDFTNKVHRNVLVKGTKAYHTTGATWTASNTVGSAKGRQLVSANPDANMCVKFPTNVWVCGESAISQFSDTGGLSSDWAPMSIANDFEEDVYAWAFWAQGPFPAYIAASGVPGRIAYLRTIGGKATQWWSALWITQEAAEPPFLVGQQGLWNTLIASGRTLARITSSAATMDVEFYNMPFPVYCGCACVDDFALSPGDHRIYLWRWDYPLRDISPWGSDGCPADLAGAVKGLHSYGEYILCLWQLDAGGSLIMWYHPERGWHIRTRDLLGNHPKGPSQPMAMSTGTVSGAHRLWVPTAATGVAGYAHRQDHPIPGLNPLNASVSYEQGPYYDYSAWYPVVALGDLVAALTRLASGGCHLTSEETLAVRYRLNYDPTPEESATWHPISTFTDQMMDKKLGSDTIQGIRAIQFRTGLKRGGTAANTPIIRHLGAFVEAIAEEPRRGR